MIEALGSLRPSWLDTELIALLGVGSLVLFLLGVVAVPLVLTRIPPDYYTRAERSERPRRSLLGWFVWLLKNAAGAVLVLLGIALLLLPGQGILTVALGLMLLDFPGRVRLERRIVGQPKVLSAINALRRRAHRPPLEMKHPE